MSNWLYDPGHGGSDPGATYKGREEDNDCLRLVNRTRELMEYNGENVKLTRVKDEFVSLDTRCIMENKGKYDYVVSFHRNAFQAEKAKGVETYSYSTKGKGRELSQNIQIELEAIFVSRGCKTANFQMLRETNCPAVLVEVGFIDNTLDNGLFDDKFELVARAIAAGCLRQVGKTLKLPTPPSSNPDILWRVVVGSFSKRELAVERQAELTAKGFDSFLAAFEKSGITYFRVVSGTFASIDSAKAKVAELAQHGFEAFLAEHKK